MLKKLEKDRKVLGFFLLKSRDTKLSARVYLNKMVIKLKVLLDCKVRNEKTQFKLRENTNRIIMLQANRLTFRSQDLYW